MVKGKSAKSIFRKVPLMVAFLAAFVFSTSNGLQSLLIDTAQLDQSVYADSETGDDERPVAYLDYAFDAIAPVAQLLVFHSSFKIAIPAIQPVQFQHQLIPSPRGSDQLFKVLFQLIISPNAP